MNLEDSQDRHKIFFCDIASASLEPNVLKTWGVIGETPNVVLNSSGHKFGVIGGMSVNGDMHGQIHFGSMKGKETVNFLENLLSKFENKITVVFDNGRNVKCSVVQEFVNSEERLDVIYLPPYAPDCNPIEFLWAWIRYDLGSLCFSGVDMLLNAWKSSWLEVVKAPELVKSFFKRSRIGDLSL